MREEKCIFCGGNMKSLISIPYVADGKIKKQDLCQCSLCGFVTESNTRDQEEVASLVPQQKVDYLSEVCRQFLSSLSFGWDQCTDVNVLLGKGLENEGLASKKSVLVISDCLEHQIDLEKFFLAVENFGFPYVYIQAPVFDYCIYHDFFGYFIKSHHNYFHKEFLIHLMAHYGYEWIDGRFEDGSGIAMPMIFPSYLGLWKNTGEKKPMEKSDQADVISNYLSECGQLVDKLNHVLGKISADLPVAVWGTSNYAEKLLAATDLQFKNIVCFYDNNMQKHNSFFCGKIIKSFSMEDVESGKVKKILIASNTAYQVILEQLSVYGIDQMILNLGDIR